MQSQNEQSGLVGGVINWWEHPYSSNGSAVQWVLFVGLLIIAIWFWNHILLQIQQKV